jgi:hypothetical protein
MERRCAAVIATAVFACATSSGLAAAHWTLIGWNNLGMHCMDDDYAIFSILPPYNTINAQLIDNNGNLVLAPGGITVTYEATTDPTGSINKSSIGKSNFWDYSFVLFGVTLAPDLGLAGNKMPGTANTPQLMPWAQAGAPANTFQGLGIPLTPIDDASLTNTYPLFKLVARDAGNNVLAETSIVLPVSSELHCSTCHASATGQADAKPAPDWVFDPDPKHDFRLNILKLHDQKNIANPDYINALAQFGYRDTGLYDSVALDGKSILCATCHQSEALGTPGAAGTQQLTTSIHSRHANVIDPSTGKLMDDSTNRSACYQCHPGSTTRCLRGAMGAAVSTADGSMLMQCQSCHGSMSTVGAATRTGWLEEPNCQACHTGDAVSNSGQIRFVDAFDSPGHLRVPTNTRFATTPNTPATGLSLFRFSLGHGGLQCEACHGSTHAEFTSSQPNDNLQSIALQGHLGKLADCSACHAIVPSTITGGPHGMHPVDQGWVSSHGDKVEHNTAQCQVCHNTNYSGTVLSRMQGTRSFSLEEGGTKSFWRGQKITCYDCHNGPGGEGSPKTPPVVPSSLSLIVSGISGSITLTANGSVSSFRIVDQPAHGTVALVNSVATYFAQLGYSGSDTFTFAATEATGFVESNLGTVAVTVGNTNPAQLLNISTRLEVFSGEQVPIGGFIINGTDPKTILVRAIGPSLPLAGAVADPVIELHGASGLLATNDNWKINDQTGQSQQTAIEATHMAPANDLESAIIATLPANGSGYTAIMQSKTGALGLGLVEIYDLSLAANSEVANISTRGGVETGDNVMIGGFISGPMSKGSSTVLIRAIGPSLPVTGTLQDPFLELHDANGVTIITNDNWKTNDQTGQSQQTQIEATGLAPANDLESAIVYPAPPAAYTAIVRGRDNTTGVALVEVYNLP